jgi:hypothetical protein
MMSLPVPTRRRTLPPVVPWNPQEPPGHSHTLQYLLWSCSICCGIGPQAGELGPGGYVNMCFGGHHLHIELLNGRKKYWLEVYAKGLISAVLPVRAPFESDPMALHVPKSNNQQPTRVGGINEALVGRRLQPQVEPFNSPSLTMIIRDTVPYYCTRLSKCRR